MESEDVAWADTCDGAANFNGKCNTNGNNVHYAPVTLTLILTLTSDIDTLYQQLHTLMTVAEDSCEYNNITVTFVLFKDLVCNMNVYV